MPVSLSEFPKPVCLGNEQNTTGLETTLKDFIHQFALSGCSLYQVDIRRQQSHQIGCWSETLARPVVNGAPLPDLEAADLEAAIAPSQMAVIESFDIRPLLVTSFPATYQLYGCLCQNLPELRSYLLCWHFVPLSEHQSYGMSLCAQVLKQRLLTDSPPVEHSQVLPAVLQRIRHQLRTPLELMSLYTDLLKATVVEGKARGIEVKPRVTEVKTREWIEHLRTAVEEMQVSLDCLTESAVLAATSMSSYDLRQLLEQCCQHMQPWLDEKRVTVVYDTQPLWLQVDGWKLKQVLQNLLSNAIAFSPIAGKVTCAWEILQTEVLIRICDNGPGLSPEDLRSFGTPFYSRRAGGMGLGVFIAKQMIAEHAGSLWAENLPDGGTQVSIVLPRC